MKSLPPIFSIIFFFLLVQCSELRITAKRALTITAVPVKEGQSIMFGQELLDVTYRDGDKIIQDKIRAPVRLTGVLLYAKAVPENGQTFMKDDVIIILEEMPAASL